jgi:hypothetical protein
MNQHIFSQERPIFEARDASRSRGGGGFFSLTKVHSCITVEEKKHSLEELPHSTNASLDLLSSGQGRRRRRRYYGDHFAGRERKLRPLGSSARAARCSIKVCTTLKMLKATNLFTAKTLI